MAEDLKLNLVFATVDKTKKGISNIKKDTGGIKKNQDEFNKSAQKTVGIVGRLERGGKDTDIGGGLVVDIDGDIRYSVVF